MSSWAFPCVSCSDEKTVDQDTEEDMIQHRLHIAEDDVDCV